MNLWADRVNYCLVGRVDLGASGGETGTAGETWRVVGGEWAGIMIQRPGGKWISEHSWNILLIFLYLSLSLSLSLFLPLSLSIYQGRPLNIHSCLPCARFLISHFRGSSESICGAPLCQLSQTSITTLWGPICGAPMCQFGPLCTGLCCHSLFT